METLDQPAKTLSTVDPNSDLPSFNDLSKPYLDALNSKNFEKLLEVTKMIRNKLGVNNSPPVAEFLKTGLFPEIVKFLEPKDKNLNELQSESLWILTNCLAGSGESITKIISKPLLETLIRLLHSQDKEIVEMALMALANASADLDDVRLSLLDLKIVEELNKYVKISHTFTESQLSNLAWLISNLSLTLKLQEEFRPLFPLMRTLFSQHNNKEVCSKIAWAYSHLSNSQNEALMEEMIDEQTLKMIINYLDTPDMNLKVPCLRIVGNLTSLSPRNTQKIVGFGALEFLEKLIENRKPTIRREAIWVISNIVADEPEMIEKVLKTSIFKKLLNTVMMDVDAAKEEALIVIMNALAIGNLGQVKEIFALKLAEFLGTTFVSDNVKIIFRGLECTESALNRGRQIQEKEEMKVNPFYDDLAAGGIIHSLEKLQQHHSNEVYQKVSNIIDTYFMEPMESEPLVK